MAASCWVIDDVHLNTFAYTVRDHSQAVSQGRCPRTSSFVGSSSPRILLKICSSASFRKSGGSGAPSACALYARTSTRVVWNRVKAVARMYWGLTAAADIDMKCASARSRIWGCAHAEAMLRMKIALEGAITCSVCVSENALRGAYFNRDHSKLTVECTTIYAEVGIYVNVSRETPS